MGLLKDLRDTYDANSGMAGVLMEGREPLTPPAHWIYRMDIEVVLERDGSYSHASHLPEDGNNTVIPVTELSAARSSGDVPHPLHDRLSYISHGMKARHEAYMAGLREWQRTAGSPVLDAVLSYTEGNELRKDLEKQEIVIRKGDDPMIRWRVASLPPPWTDRDLLASWTEHYRRMKETEKKVLCMVSGEYMSPAVINPKGMIPFFGKAKLLPVSNAEPLTYQGRAREAGDAFSIGWLTSQKVHSAMRWLVVNDGISFADRVLLCWNPSGISVPSPVSPFLDDETELPTPTEYGKALKKALCGRRASTPKDAEAVTAVFTSLSSSRISVLDSSRMLLERLEDNLAEWDGRTSWWYPGGTVRTPNLVRLSMLAGSRLTDTGLSSQDHATASSLHGLIKARMNGGPLPPRIRDGLRERLLNPLWRNSPPLWEELLSAFCAVSRKITYDITGKDMAMNTEGNEKDRSFQFGRLIAVLDAAERETFGKDVKRDSSTMKLLSSFTLLPMKTARECWMHVRKAYWQDLAPSRKEWYDTLLEDIFEELSEWSEEELDGELEDSFLFGFYLQRKELREKKGGTR